MKTIKTTIAQTGVAVYLKALIIGTTISSLCIILLLGLFSLVLLISGHLPHNFLEWFGIIITCAASFLSGYICARITKSNGLVTGVAAGIILFIIITVAGIFSGSSLSYISLVKFILSSLCGGIGGIKGVNRKDKIHIK